MRRKTRIKKVGLLMAVCLGAGAITGCGGSKDSGGSAVVDGGSAEGNASAKDTLVIVHNSEIQSTDPANQAQLTTSQVLIQMYETLMYLDENLEPQCRLAESVEQVDDLTYSIKLKKGIKFHNGEEMKASDVVYSYQRALENPKTASKLGILDPDGFEIVDDYSLIMKTLEPTVVFYGAICHPQASILSQKACEELGERIDKEACGTGPYKFVSWTPGVEIKMEAFEDYWGEKAKIKNLVAKFVDDANSRSVMLEAGEADVIYSVQTAGIEALLANDEIEVQSVPSTSIRFIFFNHTQPYLENKLIRQAICYAINKEALIDNVFGEYATPATSFLAPGVLGHTDDVELYEYNPEKAKALLAEAGFQPGELTIKFTTWQQNVQQRMVEIIQADLAEVGINMEIETVEAAAWVADLAEGTVQLGFNTNSNPFNDPDALYTPVHSSNVPAPNHGCITRPELDKLLDEGRLVKDITEREKIYVEIQKMLAEEADYYLLCYENITMANRKDLKNFTVTTDNYQHFNKCYFE